MNNLTDVYDSNYRAEAESLRSWCDSMYQTYFGGCYSLVDTIRTKVYVDESGFVHGKLSDEDLEQILTELPLDMYTAAESLNKLRLEYEMVKLKFKEIKRSITQKVRDDVIATYIDVDSPHSKSEIESEIASEIALRLVEHELLIKAYDVVMTRAENEKSACRELIMGAKKLWDSRRAADNTNPVGEVVPDLPDYQPDMSHKSYIR